jgi:PAS domain S-box-containing protein
MNFPENTNYLMEALFNYASMSIIVVDSSGNIVLANSFAQKKFGYTETELTGKKIELLIPSRFHNKHVHHRDKFVQHPTDRPMGVGMDLFAVKKDGTEFPVEVSLGHYNNNGQKFILAFLSDITIRKKDEDEIKRLNEELEEKVEKRTEELQEAMKKLQSSKEELVHSLQKEKDLSELKSRFVTMASHEFRTPLSTVLSSAFLVEKYTKSEDQDKRKKHIDRIISSVRMLTDILNDFLSVGKIEEGKIVVKPADFNLKEHISAIVNEITNIGKAGQQIVYKHTGEELVFMDPGLLKHIVMNLLSNALKFSPENSTIEINSQQTNDQLMLKVKDSGMGISREDQEHLFERFYRGSNVTNVQGTGLGLHIVAKYAELMNGKIECNSELEKGTEFMLTFLTGRDK